MSNRLTTPFAVTFCALVINWVTSKDRSEPSSQISATTGGNSGDDSNLLGGRSLSMPLPAAIAPSSNAISSTHDTAAGLPLATITRSPAGPSDSVAKIPWPVRGCR